MTGVSNAEKGPDNAHLAESGLARFHRQRPGHKHQLNHKQRVIGLQLND